MIASASPAIAQGEALGAQLARDDDHGRDREDRRARLVTDQDRADQPARFLEHADHAAIATRRAATELLAVDPAQREQRDLGAGAEAGDEDAEHGDRDRDRQLAQIDQAPSARTGNVAVNVEPWPGEVSTQIRPPCAST